MTTQKRYVSRLAPELEGRIHEFLNDALINGQLESITAPRLIRKLEGDEKLPAVLKKDLAKKKRSIERRIRDYRVEDNSGLWSMEKATGNEANIILRMLAHLTNQMATPRLRITNMQARWVVKLHEAAPKMTESSLYVLSRLYRDRVVKQEGTEDLDAFLMFNTLPDWDVCPKHGSHHLDIGLPRRPPPDQPKHGMCPLDKYLKLIENVSIKPVPMLSFFIGYDNVPDSLQGELRNG